MENFFGNPYMMWHDGINPHAAAALKGEERLKAEEMLLEAMGRGDYYAPMGLREMRSERSIPLMKAQLERAGARQMIELAYALNTLESTEEYIPYIIRVLHHAGSPFDRLVAAMRLREYNTPDVIDALFQGVLDPDYLVRNHSSESLLAIHGLPASISSHREIFQEIIFDHKRESGVSWDIALDHYKHAADMLKELFDQQS